MAKTLLSLIGVVSIERNATAAMRTPCSVTHPIVRSSLPLMAASWAKPPPLLSALWSDIGWLHSPVPCRMPLRGDFWIQIPEGLPFFRYTTGAPRAA